MALLLAPTHLESWIRENESAFSPPICNKLLHRGRLTIMLVGGPNQRKDFHSEDGSEFFWQLKGAMEVVTIQENAQKPVQIKQDHVYLLPSRTRHSPRRPANTIGLVIEREREPGELDSMCWFVDDHSSTVLWEKYFSCTDLGKDLVPVVREFEQTTEYKTGKPTKAPLGLHAPLVDRVPEPLPIAPLLEQALRLPSNGDFSVFDRSHPDGEFEVSLQTAGRRTLTGTDEMFLYQLKGSAQLYNGQAVEIKEGECVVLGFNAAKPFALVDRAEGSVGLVVFIKNLLGNKRGRPVSPPPKAKM